MTPQTQHFHHRHLGDLKLDMKSDGSKSDINPKIRVCFVFFDSSINRHLQKEHHVTMNNTENLQFRPNDLLR